MNKKAFWGITLAGFISILAVSFAVSNNPTTNNIGSNCVNVYVDFGDLDKIAKADTCVPVSESINGLTAVQEAGYNVVGTQKYPTQIVCRVNGLPGTDKEPCLNMPPADSYWAIIIKKHNKWGWAETGISDINLNRGESLGLVFTKNGKVKFPK